LVASSARKPQRRRSNIVKLGAIGVEGLFTHGIDIDLNASVTDSLEKSLPRVSELAHILENPGFAPLR